MQVGGSRTMKRMERDGRGMTVWGRRLTFGGCADRLRRGKDGTKEEKRKRG